MLETTRIDFSAYKWLLKMGGNYKSIGHAIEEKYNWMIAHGLYKENIESHISGPNSGIQILCCQI